MWDISWISTEGLDKTLKFAEKTFLKKKNGKIYPHILIHIRVRFSYNIRHQNNYYIRKKHNSDRCYLGGYNMSPSIILIWSLCIAF